MVDLATKGALLFFFTISAIGSVWALVRSLNLAEVGNPARMFSDGSFKKKHHPALFWGGIFFYLMGALLMIILALCILLT